MRLAILLSIIVSVASTGRTEKISFDSAAPGQLPPGWSAAMTHSGGAPRWEIHHDDTAPSKSSVLAQTSSDGTRNRYPLAILDAASSRDGEITVRFKPISGEIDQAAGLVWRYRDENNYYIVRANALEDNVVLYKVERGARTALAPRGAPADTYGVEHEVPAQSWSTLLVSFQGALFTVFFNGEKLFEVQDTTFTEAGKVGLWTKADSVTYFDDFELIAK